MTDGPDYKAYRARIGQWKAASVALAVVHAQELSVLDARGAIEDLSSLIDDAIDRSPMKKYSGLVDQQRLFKKLRDEQAP